MTTEQSIFVVDDEASVIDVVNGTAKSMGIRSEGFQSAEGFLSRYDRSRAGCLVLDVWLRGMSGLDLMDVMRRDGIWLPTIVVTGFADVPLAVRVMQSGAVTLLEKPYRMQELRDAIQQALAIDTQSRHSGDRVANVRTQMASLTHDERRVLELILTGRTNKAIAQELSLPLRTVEARRQSLMVKIHAGSLAELVQIVTEARMLNSVPFASPRFRTAPFLSPGEEMGQQGARPLT